jgi:hypothetical protein
MSMPTRNKAENEDVSTTVSQLEKDNFSFSSDEDVAKRRVWRKLDLHLLPLTALVYLLCFL